LLHSPDSYYQDAGIRDGDIIGIIARVGDMRSAYNSLFSKPERRNFLEVLQADGRISVRKDLKN